MTHLKAVAVPIYTRIRTPPTGCSKARCCPRSKVALPGWRWPSRHVGHSPTIQTIAESGDNIIATSTCMAAPTILFAHTFPQMGITVRFADPRDPRAVSALVDERTKGSVPVNRWSNPLGNGHRLCCAGRRGPPPGVPLIGVDNTVALTPYLCRPFGAWGRHRGAFADQIPQRSRHQHRRHHRRQRANSPGPSTGRLPA